MRASKKGIQIGIVALTMWLPNQATYGQGVIKSFGVRAGAIASTTYLTKEPANAPVFFRGVESYTSFYVGGFQQFDLSKRLAINLSVDYQRKGQTIKGIQGATIGNHIYNYIGFTPTVGLKFFNVLGLYVGPQLNYLVDKKTSWKETESFEIGGIGRLTGTFKRVSVNVGYFRAFNKFDMSGPLAGVLFNHFNRNWQAGLSYQLITSRLQ